MSIFSRIKNIFDWIVGLFGKMENTKSKLGQVLKMMEYMELDSFVVPHYNLPLPKEADGPNYRPNKLFRLGKSGLMSYKGWGFVPCGMKEDILIHCIRPTEEFISRAHSHISEDVKKKANRLAVEKIAKLILVFNGMGFLNDK